MMMPALGDQLFPGLGRSTVRLRVSAFASSAVVPGKMSTGSAGWWTTRTYRIQQ
jgi:hypothetical protein